MFRVVSILRGIFTDARNRISCLNIFYLASMLALLTGSVGATTTVQAAPREDDTVDSANVSIGTIPSVCLRAYPVPHPVLRARRPGRQSGWERCRSRRWPRSSADRGKSEVERPECGRVRTLKWKLHRLSKTALEVA